MYIVFTDKNCPFLIGCIPAELISGNNHRIEDFQLTASSHYAEPNHGAASSRLNSKYDGGVHAGAWLPKTTSVGDEWLQVNKHPRMRVIVTLGVRLIDRQAGNISQAEKSRVATRLLLVGGGGIGREARPVCLVNRLYY